MEVPFSHASPAKRVAGESEEQQSERTGDFSKKKSPQAMRSLRRTGGAGGIPFPAGNATAVAARHWRPAKSRLSNPSRIYAAAPFSHASPAKRVAGESEEQQSERTGDFSKKIAASDA